MNGENNEKFIDKLIRKTKADPLVPIFVSIYSSISWLFY